MSKLIYKKGGFSTRVILKKKPKQSSGSISNSSYIPSSAGGEYTRLTDPSVKDLKIEDKEEEKVTETDVPTTVDNPFKLSEKVVGMFDGIKPKARQILDFVFEGSKGDVVLTSGFRTPEQNETAGLDDNKGNPNSFHLTGDAIDLRPNSTLDTYLTNPENLKELWGMGYEVVDERNRKGYAPHWHLEPHPRAKYGGLIYKN